ncbi:hypothetical protein, partial [Neisseria sp. 23W00734]|uniref:hypothetical protein n=1 Tax=Neisseria sp. 23W00734 TaxID=3374307 RepID=UPI003756E182
LSDGLTFQTASPFRRPFLFQSGCRVCCVAMHAVSGFQTAFKGRLKTCSLSRPAGEGARCAAE